ncbi:MAG: hypothetical protein PHY64_02620 [Eubacteriales bacterium]|nr:hypothetical protein [Eubacteriales bacterium]
MRFRKWFIPVILSLVLVLLVWITVSDHSPIWTYNAGNNPMMWETGWQAESAGGLRELTFPQRLQAGEATIVNTLPDDIHPLVTYLYLKTDYQQVTAEIGGIPVPVSGLSTGAAGSPTNNLPWSKIQLSPDMEGQTIRLSFSGTGSKPFLEVYSLLLGSESRIRLMLFSNALPSIVLSLLIVVFALALAAFAILEARRYRKPIPGGYLHLMTFILLAGIWVFTDSDISGVHYIDSPIFFYANLFSYMLLPLPFYLFVYAQNQSMRKVSTVLELAAAAGVLSQIVLLLCGQFVGWISLLVTNAILLASCVIMPFLVIRRMEAHHRSDELFFGVVITSVVGFVSIAMFYLYPIENNARVFSYGIIVLVITFTISILRVNVNIFAQARRIEQLRIREEEYRIAVRQSDKYVLRYDVGSRTLLKGEVDSPLVHADQEVEGLPESLIASGGVAEGSTADFRRIFTDIHAGKPTGTCALNMRNQEGGFEVYPMSSTKFA